MQRGALIRVKGEFEDINVAEVVATDGDDMVVVKLRHEAGLREISRKDVIGAVFKIGDKVLVDGELGYIVVDTTGGEEKEEEEGKEVQANDNHADVEKEEDEGKELQANEKKPTTTFGGPACYSVQLDHDPEIVQVKASALRFGGFDSGTKIWVRRKQIYLPADYIYHNISGEYHVVIIYEPDGDSRTQKVKTKDILCRDEEQYSPGMAAVILDHPGVPFPLVRKVGRFVSFQSPNLWTWKSENDSDWCLPLQAFEQVPSDWEVGDRLKVHKDLNKVRYECAKTSGWVERTMSKMVGQEVEIVSSAGDSTVHVRRPYNADVDIVELPEKYFRRTITPLSEVKQRHGDSSFSQLIQMLCDAI